MWTSRSTPNPGRVWSSTEQSISAASGAEFSIPPGVDRLARQLARPELDEQLYAVAGYRPVVAARGERTSVCRLHRFGCDEITAKIHRGRVMKKMGAKSLADLVVMAEALGVRGKPPQET